MHNLITRYNWRSIKHAVATMFMATTVVATALCSGYAAGASKPNVSETTTANQSIIVSELTGLGYGNSPSQAKSDALSRIVHQINQNISFNRCQRLAQNGSAVDCSSLAFYFDFELSGIEYQAVKASVGEFGQQALLSKNTVNQRFSQAPQELSQLITKLLSQETIQPEELQQLWHAQKALEANRELLNLYGLEAPAPLSQQQTETLKALEIAAAQEVSNLDQLADYLQQLGPVQNAFIHAPVPFGSVEMTPLSELIRDRISLRLAEQFPDAEIKMRGIVSKGVNTGSKTVKQCYDAVRSIEKKCASGARISLVKKTYNDESLLLGQYKQLDNFVLLTYELVGTESGLGKTIYLKIANELLGQVRTQPINQAFDQALHKNILGDPAFQVQLGSSRGNRNILMFEQEDISLKLKMTQPGYFYIVGHVVHSDAQYSYLVELDPSTKSFVGKVSPQDINRWVEIGEFSIEPPFGVEHLQLVAANYDLSDNLAATTWDDKLGYHIINGSENDALEGLQTVRGLQRICAAATTRGFQRNCAAKVSIEKADAQPIGQQFEHESVLSYTSLPLKPE